MLNATKMLAAAIIQRIIICLFGDQMHVKIQVMDFNIKLSHIKIDFDLCFLHRFCD